MILAGCIFNTVFCFKSNYKDVRIYNSAEKHL